MIAPPDVVEAARVAFDRVVGLSVDATDLNDHDRRAIAAAGRAFVEACEAARRRVDGVLVAEARAGELIGEQVDNRMRLQRELEQRDRLLESVRAGIVPPVDLKPREAGYLGVVHADGSVQIGDRVIAEGSGAASADRSNDEARIAWLRETLADLPRREGESDYDYGARKDAIRDEIRALQARVGDEASEGALVKARRALGGAS